MTEGGAIAATRRRLPMVEVDASLALTGPHGPLTPRPSSAKAARGSPPRSPSCPTFAVCCQGPYGESARYRDFMGWEVPWFSARESLGALLTGRQIGLFRQCPGGRADAPSPSGRDSKPAVLTTSPLDPNGALLEAGNVQVPGPSAREWGRAFTQVNTRRRTIRAPASANHRYGD